MASDQRLVSVVPASPNRHNDVLWVLIESHHEAIPVTQARKVVGVAGDKLGWVVEDDIDGLKGIDELGNGARSRWASEDVVGWLSGNETLLLQTILHLWGSEEGEDD